MKMIVRLFLLGVFLITGLVACGDTVSPSGSTSANPQQREPSAQLDSSIAASHGGPIKDHVSFVDALRANGLAVDIVGDAQQPFLRAKGTKLHLSGGGLKQPVEVQSYNYDDTDLGTDGIAAAQADAGQIGPNGMPKTVNVQWSAMPHWFGRERVIVLYLGNDPAALTLLTTFLGPQFAGQ